MEQEIFLISIFQRVHKLFVVACAKRGHHHGLGFAAGEQSRAMCAWQHAHLAVNRPHIGQPAPINALFACQNRAAHNIAFHRFHRTRTHNALFVARIIAQ